MSTMTNDDNDGEADHDDDKDNEYVLSLCENAFTENERLNGAWEACLKTLKMLTITKILSFCELLHTFHTKLCH